MLSTQTIDTSSLCPQLCWPHPPCWQSASDVSLPRQWTLSSRIWPVPGPKALRTATPIFLNQKTSHLKYFSLTLTAIKCTTIVSLKSSTILKNYLVFTIARVTNKLKVVEPGIILQYYRRRDEKMSETDILMWEVRSVCVEKLRCHTNTRLYLIRATSDSAGFRKQLNTHLFLIRF